MLDRLRPTAAGLDAIPAWFLRLGAPVFAAPVAFLFHQSVIECVVPSQWKTAGITPVPKVSKPVQPSDFRPISLTPVLSRSLERYIVRSYIYPALQHPPPGLSFDDQFAFRPSGSTTAAVIALLHTVCTMLSTNDFVHVLSFDFTKVFDSVRHATFMSKMVQLHIPDSVSNWIKDYFQDRSHCTRYAGECSSIAEVKASIIQRYGLGPVSYLVMAADFHLMPAGNRIFKYADDTYLLLASSICQLKIATRRNRA